MGELASAHLNKDIARFSAWKMPAKDVPKTTVLPPEIPVTQHKDSVDLGTRNQEHALPGEQVAVHPSPPPDFDAATFNRLPTIDDLDQAFLQANQTPESSAQHVPVYLFLEEGMDISLGLPTTNPPGESLESPSKAQIQFVADHFKQAFGLVFSNPDAVNVLFDGRLRKDYALDGDKILEDKMRTHFPQRQTGIARRHIHDWIVSNRLFSSLTLHTPLKEVVTTVGLGKRTKYANGTLFEAIVSLIKKEIGEPELDRFLETFIYPDVQRQWDARFPKR